MFISFRTSVFSVWTSVFILNDKCFYVLGQVLGVYKIKDKCSKVYDKFFLSFRTSVLRFMTSVFKI